MAPKKKAYNNTVMNMSLVIDSMGIFSSMDDIFDCLLMLASYIGHRFIQCVVQSETIPLFLDHTGSGSEKSNAIV